MSEPMPEPMDPLARLLATEACRELVQQAARCVDAHDAAGFAALFTADAVLERPSGAPIRGRAAIREAYAARPSERLTCHLVTHTHVEFSSAVRASASSSVLLWATQRQAEAGPQGRAAEGPQVLGEFHDECTLTPEGWRIARRRALFLMHQGG